MEQSSLALLCVPVYHWYFQYNSQFLPYYVTLYIIGTLNGTVKSCLSLCPCISLVLSMVQSSLDLLCYPVKNCYLPWNSQVLPNCVTLYIIGTFNGTVKSCLTVWPCISLVGTFNGTVKSCLIVWPYISLVLSMVQSCLALLCVPVYHWYFHWNS